ncbi:MAG: polyprenyl synthetase family protein [Lachnospirales bacterium]
MNFENNIKQYIDAVNKKLEGYLSPKYPEDIYKAMGYSVFAGGKRVRPVLMLAACEAFGGNIKDVLPYACGLEMIHTYSLIHDDLPAMDNDDYRRGKLTCHKAFNEGLAILAGDGLLTYAFDVMLSDALEKEILSMSMPLKLLLN